MTTLRQIDWARLPEPQADGYDTAITLQLGARTTKVPHWYSKQRRRQAPSVLSGRIALDYVYGALPEFELLRRRYRDAPREHPSPIIAEQYLSRWPEFHEQIAQLIDAIHPALLPGNGGVLTPVDYPGSHSHSLAAYSGTLWATVDSPIGFAHALVHETAHQKLRVLGVPNDGPSRLFVNHRSERYVSPIIKDRLRPMSAVFHAAYSFLHVLALDIRMYLAERDPHTRIGLRKAVATNMSRVEAGVAEVARYARVDVSGRLFVDACLDWARRELERARIILDTSSANEGISTCQ